MEEDEAEGLCWLLKMFPKAMVRIFGPLEISILRLKRGGVFCLLGPNGAGKTTLVKGILDLINFNKGKAFIEGVRYLSTSLFQEKCRLFA